MPKRQRQLSQARMRMNRMSKHHLANFYSMFSIVRQEMDFLGEWGKLCFDLGIPYEKSEIVGEILEHQYMQPHRKYHDIQHVEDCLALLHVCTVDKLLDSAGDYSILRFALFMHDAVYDTWAEGNEERCIGFSNFCADRLGVENSPVVPEGFMGRVTTCIRATDHLELAEGHNQQLCADIDLFGQSIDWDAFISFERKIRQEYFWKTDDEFAAGNSAILKRLIERPYIYQTQWFRDNFEKAAQANTRRLLEERGQL